jgi:hypothetical protein
MTIKIDLSEVKAEIDRIVQDMEKTLLAQHDARVAELLEVNNREVERRRAAEARLRAAHDCIRSFCTAPPAVMSSRIGDLTIDSDGMRKATDAIDILWCMVLKRGIEDYILTAKVKKMLMDRQATYDGVE